jgi:glycerophosphoryl diester phosphodiesterase
MMWIGHRGAAALAPENTLRSIECALEVGVDMVEVDVLALADGTLVLAHSDDLLEVSHGAASGSVTEKTLAELRAVAPELPALDEALALVTARGAAVMLDVKHPGYERPLVEAVRRHGLAGRSLVSSCYPESLRRVAALEPGLRRGRTLPFDRFRLGERRLLRLGVPAALRALRLSLPRRIGGLLAAADASVATLHHSLVSAATVRACHERDAQVLAWTVDDRGLAIRLARLGVDGIITDDPRIVACTF